MPGRTIRGECQHISHGQSCVVHHTFPGGELRAKCMWCMKEWVEAPKEETVAVDLEQGLPNVLKVYIKNRAAGNVIIHNVMSAFNIAESSFALRCKVCQTQYCWTPNETYPYGIDLKFVEQFCEGHAECSSLSTPKEGKVLPFPVKEPEFLPEPPVGRKFR